MAGRISTVCTQTSVFGIRVLGLAFGGMLVWSVSGAACLYAYAVSFACDVGAGLSF